MKDWFKKFFSINGKQSTFNIIYQVCWNFILIFLILAVVTASFGIGTAAGYFAAVVRDQPILNKEQFSSQFYNYEQTSEIYFANDVYLGKMRTDLEREIVSLDEVSPLIINAVIAVEDNLFYEHNGIVPRSIFRAVFQEASGSSMQSGGSTLTQQLIKMQVLNNEVSFDRKFKEILLAQRVEKYFTKDELIEAYLNIVPFGRNPNGRNIAGIQTAAKSIFGIDASDVTLPQAAFLAGLPNNPFQFSPYSRMDGIKTKEGIKPGIDRMQLVLRRMLETGHITRSQFEEAKEYDITKDFRKPSKRKTKDNSYPFIMAETEKRAIEILQPIIAERNGYTEEEIEKSSLLREQLRQDTALALQEGGYRIHLTIDKKIYDAMEEATATYRGYHYDYTTKNIDPETGQRIVEPVEAGAILIDNYTGAIISFVGGRDFDRSQTNHATSAYRPNGSTMKPLLIFGPAMDMGLSSPGKPLVNVKVGIPIPGAQPYSPANYGGGYGGGANSIVTTRFGAIQWSYNIPAIVQYSQVLKNSDRILGTNPVKYYLEDRLGFTDLEPGDYVNLSAGLGSVEGATLEHTTNAYVSFATDGKFAKSYMIDRIEEQDGTVIYQHEVEPIDAFEPETSFMMRSMLRDVVTRGTAASAGYIHPPGAWSGKTGTTSDYRDALFVAFNPSVTFGVWSGYDTPANLDMYGGDHSGRNNRLWSHLINAAYAANPDPFKQKPDYPPQPSGIGWGSYPSVSGTKFGGADYYNTKFPISGNTSSTTGQFVTINGQRYLAHANTPPEFIETGTVIGEDALNDMGYEYVLDKRSLQGFVSGGGSSALSLPSDNSAPSAVTAKISGNTLSWSASGSNNVIGYYIYRTYNGATKRVTHVKGDVLSYKLGSKPTGDYHIQAVNISGKLSAVSNIVSTNSADPEPEPDEKTDDD